MTRSHLIIPCILLAACGSPGASGPITERADSSGVEILTAGTEDVPLNWTFAPLFSVGGEEEGLESFYYVLAGTVAVDASGAIYVLDSEARRVVVFDSTGAVLRTMGTRGRGPGEIESPGSLGVSADGVAAVFDFAKMALVRFGPDGEVLPEVPFVPTLSMRSDQRHFVLAGNGYLVSRNIVGIEPDDWNNTLLRIEGSDTTQLASVSLARPTMAMYPSCGGGLNLPALFAPDLLWDHGGGRLAVSASPDYVVQVFEGNRLVRSLRRAFEPIAATRELAIRELGEGFTINFGRGPCRIDPAEMVEKRGYAENIPLIDLVRVAPSGETWVRRRLIGEEEQGPIDVFAAAGDYLGTLPAGTPFPLAFLGDDRVLLRETDDFEVQRLTLATVRREGS